MNRRAFLQMTAAAPVLASARLGSAGGQAPARPGTGGVDEIGALVTAKMAEYRVPGVAVGLLHDGQLHLNGYGVTSLDDPQPITHDTLFTIASISKTMTATAVMALVEAGRVDLRAPVRAYLPQFRVQEEEASRTVSLWHLLTHTPGWEGQLGTEDRGADALAHFASSVMPGLPQLARPGEVWSYNNAGFALCGRLIEAVTKRGIHDALRELVFAPLGLTRTVTRLTEAMTYRMSLGHRGRDGRAEVIRPFQTTSSTTAGGVMTSLADLMQYARFHLDGTTAGGATHLPRAALALMQAPQVRKNSTVDDMGLGWHLRTVGGVTTMAHGGTLNGHCLLLQLVPARNLAFAVLTNHQDGWRLVQDVEHAMLRRFAGATVAPGQAIGHRGVNEAMTFHAAPLGEQPQAAEYVGVYRRPPVGGTVEVHRTGGQLVAVSGASQPAARLVFYGQDVAYALDGSYLGMPYEFVRAADGAVRWIRVNGRIARRDT